MVFSVEWCGSVSVKKPYASQIKRTLKIVCQVCWDGIFFHELSKCAFLNAFFQLILTITAKQNSL